MRMRNALHIHQYYTEPVASFNIWRLRTQSSYVMSIADMPSSKLRSCSWFIGNRRKKRCSHLAGHVKLLVKRILG